MSNINQDNHKQNKLDRLDDAFLFVLGSIGLLFSILQIYFEGVSGLILIFPLLILGIVLPFYVGYLRGAIEVGTVTERTRGWIYLVVGVTSYFSFFLSRLNIILALILPILTLFYVSHLYKWINQIFYIDEEITNEYAFSWTATTAFILAFIFILAKNFYSDVISIKEYSSVKLLDIQLLVMVLLGSSLICLIGERLSRSIIGAKISISDEEILRRKKINVALKIPLYGMEMLKVISLYWKKGKFLLAGTLIPVFSVYFMNSGFDIPILSGVTLANIFLFIPILSLFVGLVLFIQIKKIDVLKMEFSKRL